MQHAAAVSFAVLLGSTALAAQSPDQKQTNAAVIQSPAGNATCPVTMRARQGSIGGLRTVRNSPPKGNAQWLHLTLANNDRRRITGGEVTVRGLMGKGRITETVSTGDDSDSVLKLPVEFTAGDNKDVFADLWVPGMTAVHSIELNSVTYADGSAWKLPAGPACRTIPDPMMLVSEH